MNVVDELISSLGTNLERRERMTMVIPDARIIPIEAAIQNHGQLLIKFIF